MRLCFLADAGSVHSYRWVKYFAEHGHRVDWLSLSATRFPAIPDVEFHLIGSRRATAGRAAQVVHGAWTARRLVRAEPPDVLHAHYVGVNGVIATLCGVRPLVLTAWGSDVLYAARARGTGALVRMALRRADLITCDAHHIEDAIARLGVPRDRIAVVYFGTDTRRFRRLERDAALAEHLAVRGAPVVLSIRSLYPVYDVAILLEAVPDVLRVVPTAKFLIGGDGPEAATLRRLAESLGVAGSVMFLGVVANEELPRYFNLADVYVSTALSDAGLAASTAEAMACELPVVVTDSGENRVWVQDGANGFMVPCRDRGTLAERIVTLLQNADLRRSFGRANRAVIAERNDFATEMSRMEQIYAGLTGGRVAARPAWAR